MFNKSRVRKLSNRVEKHNIIKMQKELREAYIQRSLMTFL